MLDKKILEEYKKMLYDPSIEYESVLDYMVKYVPDKLYKFKTFDEYLKSNLYDGLIYMGSPNDFNDPFDSTPHMDVNKFWNQTARPFYNVRDNIDIEIDLEEYVSDLQGKIRNAIIETTHKEVRVSCFTEKWDSLLMWAHYGNSHKGYCIEYNTTFMPSDIKRHLLPVIYQNEIYDSTNDIAFNNPNCFNFLLHKGNEWSYENEWRIAIHEKWINGELIFKDYISSVIIGINCSPNNKKEIKKWARESKKDLFQAGIAYDHYALRKNKIF